VRCINYRDVYCSVFPPTGGGEVNLKVIWEGFNVVEKAKQEKTKRKERKKGKKKGKKMELMNRIKERKMGSFPRSMEQYKSLIIGFGCFLQPCTAFPPPKCR